MKTTRSAAFTPLQRPPAKPRRNSSKPSATRTLKRPAGRAPLRAEFRLWRASLPTALERDTLLMPEIIAECVVREVEHFLKAELPADYADRLAARAYHLYPRHRHFHRMLNRPGNRGRDHLYMYMRHWTAAWLKREHRRLFKQLPDSFSVGRQLSNSHLGVIQSG